MGRTIGATIGMGFMFSVSSSSLAQDFGAAVETVLMRQKEITDLSPGKQREMITCVTGVLADVPEPTKAEVAKASNPDEMEDRFGEMVIANQAECGDIVMSQ